MEIPNVNVQVVNKAEDQISRILNDIIKELKPSCKVDIPKVETGSGCSLEYASRALKNI